MSARVEIRPLAAPDRAAWDPLWRAYLAFYETARSSEIFDLTFARYTDPGRADMLAWMAWEGTRALGLAHVIVHPHGWQAAPVTYLQDLFTAPEARGRGVGRALIETIYADADGQGRPNVYWTTQIDNSTARALYDQVAQPPEFIKYVRG